MMLHGAVDIVMWICKCAVTWSYRHVLLHGAVDMQLCCM